MYAQSIGWLIVLSSFRLIEILDHKRIKVILNDQRLDFFKDVMMKRGKKLKEMDERVGHIVSNRNCKIN